MEKLFTKFNQTIQPQLKSVLLKKNNFEIPRILKVVVSAGVGEFKDDEKMVEKISEEMAKITGQKPVVNKSKKAVSSFKLRIGQPVGITTTIRGERMYDFIDRLINVALPRVRDFRGLSKKAFDSQGNYSIGIKDYAIFPEIKYEDIIKNFGFQVNIKTSATNDEDAMALFIALGFPFEKKNIKKPVEEVQQSPAEEIKDETAIETKEQNG